MSSIHDYEELKHLGCGGCGAVSLVQCRQDDRQYALKKISIENLGGDYVHEATVLCQLNHSNVLAYKTCFRYHNSFCLVMEYCPGGDLSKDIERRKQRRQPFNERDVVNWTIQLCHALEYIHKENIIHRDLKPANIFLADNDVVKIGDFGLARELQPGDMAASVVGTVPYMSPEIASGRAHNSKTDIYSLGCCLYELMTLHSYINVHDWITRRKRTYGKMPGSGYSAALVSLVTQMLSEQPDRRPSASEILQSPAIRNYANTNYISFNITITSKPKLFVIRKDSTVQDLYKKVAEYAEEDERNFMLTLNGCELDKAKRLCDYTFANDPQSGMFGQNLTNLVFVRRQIGGCSF